MEEVIARRSKIREKSGILFIIIGILAILMGIFVLILIKTGENPYPQDRQWALNFYYIIPIVSGVFGICYGLFIFFKAKTLPIDYITLSDKTLILADGTTCTPEKIKEVDYKVFNAYRGWGTLNIILSDRMVEYIHVENVAQAKQRLTEFMSGRKES